jgi:arabinose-5-phosphate isomerase
MLKELFTKQRRYLDYFFDHLDAKECDPFLQALLSCKGHLFFTGVGKSGYIAQKVSATMMSTGTKSLFLSPIDALHGDLGMVSKEDSVVIFSKSGETDELLHLLPPLRNKGVTLFAITSNRASRLAKGVDFFVSLPCEQELCPFDLAPTISTTVQLLFGDAIAMAAMQAKGFRLVDYAENHPGGQIGRRITVKVKDLMLDREKTPLCLPIHRLEEVLTEFTDKRCGCLIVTDEKSRLKGIFTDGDLRRALQAKGDKVLKDKVGDLMTTSPRTIDVDALAWEALKLMEADQKSPIMVLPVLDREGQKVVGIIKMHDLIQAGI